MHFQSKCNDYGYHDFVLNMCVKLFGLPFSNSMLIWFCSSKFKYLSRIFLCISN